LREYEIKSVAEREIESETWAQNSFVEDNNHLAMHVIGMSKENM